MRFADYKIYSHDLCVLSLSINQTIVTLNAHSHNIAHRNAVFKEALQNSDILLPDGISIVWAVRFLTGKKIKKIAGADVFAYLIDLLNKQNGSCFFLGSSDETLNRIKLRLHEDYPNIKAGFFSPPFKNEFDENDNHTMISQVNDFAPDVLFVGMTAPKQEIWTYQNRHRIHAKVICNIGAVFDFYAGTKKRVPRWLDKLGLEWFYRFIQEPRRMWKRYLIGNSLFIYYVLKEKFTLRINQNQTDN